MNLKHFLVAFWLLMLPLSTSAQGYVDKITFSCSDLEALHVSQLPAGLEIKEYELIDGKYIAKGTRPCTDNEFWIALVLEKASAEKYLAKLDSSLEQSLIVMLENYVVAGPFEVESDPLRSNRIYGWEKTGADEAVAKAKSICPDTEVRFSYWDMNGYFTY